MASSPSQSSPAVPRLSLMDASCVMVGIVVGSAIFRMPPFIASNAAGALLTWFNPGAKTAELVGNNLWLAHLAIWGVWICGGILALCGALCYAELVTSRPSTGGTFAFLRQAFGTRLAFLFAWCEFWLIRPGNIGAIALVFADFAQKLFLSKDGSSAAISLPPMVWGAIAIAVLTLIHLAGIHPGTKTQNALTFLKVGGLILVILIALLPFGVISAAEAAVASTPATFSLVEGGSLFTAFVMVMFTYGGWSDLSYVAAEVREPRKNLLRSLILGMLGIAALYIGANAALIGRVGLLTFMNPETSLAELMATLPLGAFGEKLISLLVCISCLGSIAGMIFTGARIPSAVGAEVSWLRWLSKWNEAQGTPWVALLLQGVLSVGLVLIFGWYEGGFENLIIFTAPFYWSFLGLVGVALMLLRKRPSRAESPYRVPFYPVTPIIFIASSAVIVFSATQYSLSNFQLESIWGLVVIVTGGIAMLLINDSRRAN